MKNRLRSLGSVLSFVGCLAFSGSAFSQLVNDPGPIGGSGVPEPVVEDWLGASSRSLALERQQSAPDVDDPAFDVYVSPTLIGSVLESGDPTLITDVALQLAEGERVLLRSRKGITAEQAVQLAANAASHKKDKASLDRLAKHAASRNDQQLMGQIAAALKLGGESRQPASYFNVPVDRISLPEYRRLRLYKQEIDRAQLLGDLRALEALEQDVDTCIPKPFRGDVSKLIHEARSCVPEGREGNEQLISALRRLSGNSRSDEEDEKADEPVPVNGAP